ncbi:MAG: hypothetical protein NDJ89_02185 [Oligoflexia bacterium]|nr:hypothetical protein [Oligoflexia bacterium]
MKLDHVTRLGSIGTLALATSLIASAALAETAPAAPTTTANAQAVAPTFMEKISVSYVGILAGPSVAHPLSSLQPDENGAMSEESPVTLISSVSAGYKITDSIRIGPMVNFDYIPVRGQQMILRDSGIRANLGTLFKAGNFDLSGDVRGYAPTDFTEAGQARHLLGALRSTQIANYKLGESRFTLGVAAFETFYAYTDQAADARRKLRVYFAPSIAYEITPAISASLMWEQDRHYVLTRGWGNRSPADIALGFSFDVTPTVNLTPSVTIYPNDTVNADAAQLGMLIVAKLI